MIKIDKGIPAPPLAKGAVRYPWKDMNVGDSFFAPDVNVLNFQRNSYTAQRSHGHVYRIVPEGTGARAFRIA